MSDETPTKEKAATSKPTTIAVITALLTSLGGNGYLSYQSSSAQDQLVQQETARVESLKDLAELKAKHAALTVRFQDHLRASATSDSLVQGGLQGVRDELSGVKDTLIKIAAKLP